MSEQLEFPYSEPTTSKDAARRVNPQKAKTDRERILAYLKTCGVEGATDEQMQLALNLSGNTQRPRRRELNRAHFIRRTMVLRQTTSNRSACVWVLAEFWDREIHLYRTEERHEQKERRRK